MTSIPSRRRILFLSFVLITTSLNQSNGLSLRHNRPVHNVPIRTNTNVPLYATPSTETTTTVAKDNNAVKSSTTGLIEGLWKSIESLSPINRNDGNKNNIFKVPSASSPAYAFVQAVADGDIDQAMTYIADTVEFVDTDYSSPLNKDQLERNLRIRALTTTSATDRVRTIQSSIYDPITGKAVVTFMTDDGKKCAAFFQTREEEVDTKDDSIGAVSTLKPTTKKMIVIDNVFWVRENQKQGAVNLQILKLASDTIEAFGKSTKPKMEVLNGRVSSPSSSVVTTTKSLPEQYFDAWNERDMERATSVFSNDVEYDDTAFQKPFQGKIALEKHLNVCADALPEGFCFVLDDIVDVGNQVMVLWHVENNGEELPFTRGCSFYEMKNGKIISGTDWKEPAVFKLGAWNTFVSSVIDSLKQEPVRLIPVAVWVTYCYVVFFSDWFFGVPAQALETRTWEEVRDLSLNFFLVSPLLGLPFAPVVHPGLEGIFNLLLSWAALFAGFLSDDRPKKPNPLPMLPMVAGMQFLTSAFLLPYLATRTSESDVDVTQEELTTASRVTESRLLGPAMGVVGSGSILWGLLARHDSFGGLSERYSSLIELLSIDRVGSSFLVDLAIFALFQGWLVDDDLKRRGVDNEDTKGSLLFQSAKYVPFFGMVAYLTFRPPIPSKK